jgi:hypothetical protein
MQDPVMSRYGNRFERMAILKWINEDDNSYCPVTGKPLRVSGLVSDKTLKWKIQYWAKEHGRAVVEVEEDVEFDALNSSFGGFSVALPDPRFFCPLTKEIMENPVMSNKGCNFERKAILKWMDDMGDICPVTNTPLKPSDLVSNGKLQWEICQWQLHYGDDTKEMTRVELESKLSKASMVSKDFQIADILRALTVENDAREGEEKQEEKAPSTENVLDVLDDVVGALDA